MGIEIVSNEAVPEWGTRSYVRADTQFLTDTTKGGSFFTDHGLRDNGSPQPDPVIHNKSTVDNAGIGSPPDTAPEQSSDMAAVEFTPVAGEADPGENARDKSQVDANTEQPANTPDEKIVSPMGGATTAYY